MGLFSRKISDDLYSQATIDAVSQLSADNLLTKGPWQTRLLTARLVIARWIGRLLADSGPTL